MHCNIHFARAEILRLVVSNTWIIIECLACLLNKRVVSSGPLDFCVGALNPSFLGDLVDWTFTWA